MVHRLFVIDWDGDRKKDIVTGDGSGKINVFLNTGSDGAPLFDTTPSTVVSLEAGRVSPFVVTDWDGDARMDIIAGTSDGFLKLYLKDDSGNIAENPDGSVIPAPDGIINVADSLILLRAALGDIILPVLPRQ